MVFGGPAYHGEMLVRRLCRPTARHKDHQGHKDHEGLSFSFVIFVIFVIFVKGR
jgi:hypothetical protein